MLKLPVHGGAVHWHRAWDARWDRSVGMVSSLPLQPSVLMEGVGCLPQSIPAGSQLFS